MLIMYGNTFLLNQGVCSGLEDEMYTCIISICISHCKVSFPRLKAELPYTLRVVTNKSKIVLWDTIQWQEYPLGFVC